MEYEVLKESGALEAQTYFGYIGKKYAGCITGIPFNEHRFEILSSTLKEEFRGTKAVRAWKEITDAIFEDYPVITTRISNKDNAEIKIVLSAGFHIVGTKTYKDDISVEILKTRED